MMAERRRLVRVFIRKFRKSPPSSGPKDENPVGFNGIFQRYMERGIDVISVLICFMSGGIISVLTECRNVVPEFRW